MTPERPIPNDQKGLPTWSLAKIIEGQKIMGDCLALELANLPSLRGELSHLIHDTLLSYEDVIRHHFLSLDLPTILNNPLIRCFEAAPQCRQDEHELLAWLRQPPTDESLRPQLTAEFQEWLDRRIGYLAKGLERSVLDHAIVQPLSKEEQLKKRDGALKLWRQQFPQEASRIQKAASQKAAEVATARIFTPAVRAQIQEWFDRDLDYQTTTELLMGIGVYTTYKSLAGIVSEYDDLHYTPDEIRKNQRKGVEEATGEIFQLSGSREKTKEILEKLGISRGKTHDILNQLGLRESVDWTKPVNVGEMVITLQDLAISFMAGNYPTVKEEYLAFTNYLQEKGIEKTVSFGSYGGVRRKLLKRTLNNRI
ncbi:MAG: hypothetical protein AAB599_01305 [Patescibacteria group bacterium]